MTFKERWGERFKRWFPFQYSEDMMPQYPYASQPEHFHLHFDTYFNEEIYTQTIYRESMEMIKIKANTLVDTKLPHFHKKNTRYQREVTVYLPAYRVKQFRNIMRSTRKTLSLMQRSLNSNMMNFYARQHLTSTNHYYYDEIHFSGTFTQIEEDVYKYEFGGPHSESRFISFNVNEYRSFYYTFSMLQQRFPYYEPLHRQSYQRFYSWESRYMKTEVSKDFMKMIYAFSHHMHEQMKMTPIKYIPLTLPFAENPKEVQNDSHI